jgi:protein-tyrosine-phosphatase
VERVSLLVVCTGNASRSVMAGLMLELLADQRGLELSVTTAGTHAVEGLPLGARTDAALRTVDELVGIPSAGCSSGGRALHRSRQLRDDDLRAADLIVAMEVGHVRYVRRRHPDAAPRTGTLRWLASALPTGPSPLPFRVAALDCEHARLDESDDVKDPAGGDDAAYSGCAAELWVLCKELAPRL